MLMTRHVIRERNNASKITSSLLLEPVRGVLFPTLLLQDIGLLQHFLLERFGILLHLHSQSRNGRSENADSQQGGVSRVVDP